MQFSNIDINPYELKKSWLNHSFTHSVNLCLEKKLLLCIFGINNLTIGVMWLV